MFAKGTLIVWAPLVMAFGVMASATQESSNVRDAPAHTPSAHQRHARSSLIEKSRHVSRSWSEGVSTEAEDKSAQRHVLFEPAAARKGITIGTCLTTEFGMAVGTLLAVAVALSVMLTQEKKKYEQLTTKVRGLRAKLRVDRKRVKDDEQQLRKDAQTMKEYQSLVKDHQGIHDRNNVEFDPQRWEIVLKRAIEFDPTSIARFKDPQFAKAILADVAEILCSLQWASLLIEGHTIGSALNAYDELEVEIADARALLVRDTLIAFGTPFRQLEAIGLPGALGNNRSEVLLKLVN